MTGNVIKPVPKTTVVQDYMPQSPGDGAQLYVKYRDDVPIAYAYGESWVAQALFMDDIGYPTEEEARLAWEQRQKMRKEVEEQLG